MLFFALNYIYRIWQENKLRFLNSIIIWEQWKGTLVNVRFYINFEQTFTVLRKVQFLTKENFGGLQEATQNRNNIEINCLRNCNQNCSPEILLFFLNFLDFYFLRFLLKVNSLKSIIRKVSVLANTWKLKMNERVISDCIIRNDSFNHSNYKQP